MKTERERQVCRVEYFEDKRRRPVKAVTTFRPDGRPCIQFSIFVMESNRRRARS